MLVIAFIMLGLCMGSFINALVWRIKQQELHNKKLVKGKQSNSELRTPNYSVLNGRSMCPNCKHQLSATDLIPVISWIGLKGRCRYCKKPISWQYPLVEISCALLFVLSYVLWPNSLADSWQIVNFASWLIMVVGLMALFIYDLKWMILPDRIIFPLLIIELTALLLQFMLGRPLSDISSIAFSALIGGGIFLVIFAVSKGNWIGGGDIKLGLLLGLIVGKAEYAFIFMFLSSLLALLLALPLLVTKRLKKNSKIPYGPFLIVSCFIVVVFGPVILSAYESLIGIY